MQLTRREAAVSGLAAALLSGCARTLGPPNLDATIPRAFVDVHCHVFNAHDIPVTPFLIDTALKEEDVKQPWIDLAVVLADAITAYAALGDPERELIGHDLLSVRMPSEADEDARFRQLLEGAIRGSIAQGRAAPGANRVIELNPEGSLGHSIARSAPESFLFSTRQGPVSANFQAAAILRLLRAFALAERSINRIEALMTRSPGRLIQLNDAVPDADVKALASALAQETTDQQTDYGAVLYVASILMRTRQHNVAILDRTLGVSQATPSIVRLYVPALVDFDCWYVSTPDAPSLSIDIQTQIMARLSKLQDDPHRFVNGYVAFDPLRALLVEANLVAGPSPLETVRMAVEERGFLGVKLYPPMGFAPTNNSLDNGSYGTVAGVWIDRLASRYRGPGKYQFGRELDRVLDTLYLYCLAHDVAIMAHCGDSQASFAEAGARAAPSGWRNLLARTDHDFSRLRLNLAHFGSFWCHEAAAHPPSADPYSNDARCNVAAGWTTDIMGLAAESVANGPRFPNVYFDIADMGEITTSQSALQNLENTLNNFSSDQRALLASRVLYGTDWFFLALAGKQHVNYIPQVEKLIGQYNSATNEGAFHSNAARFLGLVNGSNTVSRLQGFYGDNAERVANLSRLIV